VASQPLQPKLDARGAETARRLRRGTQVGIAIEAAMAKKFGGMSKEYKAKYRSISFNLKDARNPDLRRKVIEMGRVGSVTLRLGGSRAPPVAPTCSDCTRAVASMH
jgi:hypothetical protein